MSIKNYTKKPITIQAIKYDGNNIQEIIDFVGNENLTFSDVGIMQWSIKTLEGDMLISLGDYVIKGVKGEFYPCKPDIFEMTYDKGEGRIDESEKRLEFVIKNGTIETRATNFKHHFEVIGLLRYVLVSAENDAIKETEKKYGNEN